MIVAIFARTLRSGVSVEEFVRAWAPNGPESYSAQVEVALDPADDRRILTIIRFDGSLEDFEQATPRLIHPQSHERLDKIVESTQLEGVYQSVSVDI
ncbi:MAG: hypothetical protein ACRDQZ_22360 [Mycobacteriales bacterium]